MYTLEDLYDLDHTLAKDFLLQFTYPWEALAGIKEFILTLGPTLGEDYEEVQPQVWVHKSATVFPSAYLGAPCIIGPNTEVRHGAFVRGSALVGANCVVGNSVELKNVILFDNVQTPHYNYVGDSILGHYSHMGAGSITSNVKADKQLVVVHNGTEQMSSTPVRSLAAGATSIPRRAYAASCLSTPSSRTVATSCRSTRSRGVTHGKVFRNRWLSWRVQQGPDI